MAERLVRNSSPRKEEFVLDHAARKTRYSADFVHVMHDERIAVSHEAHAVIAARAIADVRRGAAAIHGRSEIEVIGAVDCCDSFESPELTLSHVNLLFGPLQGSIF